MKIIFFIVGIILHIKLANVIFLLYWENFLCAYINLIKQIFIDFIDMKNSCAYIVKFCKKKKKKAG